MVKVLLSVLFFMLLMCTCQRNRNTAKPQSTLFGRYTLTAYDNLSQLAFTGSISITSVEQDYLKGQCTIVRGPALSYDLFNQDGPCEARVEGTALSFDLAPMMDDGGLLLEGQFDDSRITGIWKLDGFVTSEPLGRFEAVKKRE